MNFIAQEQAMGVINGINTIFTLSNQIFQIDQVVVDGLPYLGSIVPNNNQITLGDAPLVSVYVWYYVAPVAPGPPPPPPPGSYFTSDMNFDNLTNLVLRELKEPEVTGSEAVSLGLVQDTLNLVYAEAFNDQRMKQSAREENVSFLVANDTTLVNDTPAFSGSLVLSNSSSFKPAGRVLMLSEMCDYTANDGNQTLTGITEMTIRQLSGTVVRQMYRLTDLAADIEEESLQYIDVNGIPLTFMEYPTNITAINFYPNSYSIYKGFLIISRQSTLGGDNQQQSSLMIYTQKVLRMTDPSDTPLLIPNSWRNSILVYGACMKIAASDAFRTSFDWWGAEYNRALSQYIAFRNTRVKDINNRRRPSLYSRGNGGFSGF